MSANSNYLWWQTGVFYQVYTRSFMDSTGNGVGDLRGVIEKLDYLGETLGVDAIWLSPFYPSPMADFGYDVTDHTDVDPLFGDLTTFDELVAQAHQRGLKILIDYIPNHTSDQHPWFLESRSSRDNPKRDWFVWANSKSDGSPPNNWLSFFGGSAWAWDEGTGQYYLHSFLKEQPDLNWRNPALKEAMFDVARFWLERGVDGFRVDVPHWIMKDPQMRDNPPNSKPGDYHKPLGEYDTQLHLYDKGHPDVHQIYREFRQLLDSYSEDRPRFTIGEIHVYDWSKWLRYYGENLDELHMPFNFALLNAEWDAFAVREVVDSLETTLPPGAWPNYVLGNHDEPRLTTRIGQAQSRVAAVLLLTLRGTPTIYYGDEIGMTNVHIRTERMQDPWGLHLPGLERDGCRTPMQWNGGSTAGFSSAKPEQLWLPLGNDYREVNVAQQLQYPDSILNLYWRLLALRKSSIALQVGSYRSVSDVPEDCFVYIREHENESLLVALNFASRRQRVLLPPRVQQGRILLSSHLDRRDEVARAELTLRGNEAVVVTI